MPSQEMLHIDDYVHHVVNDPLLEGKPWYQQYSSYEAEVLYQQLSIYV
jgi:hypothetical protein